MDWDVAIQRNRDALLAIVATFFSLAGLAGGRVPETLPRVVHASISRFLLSADSALRRLIVIVAQGMSVSPVASQPTSHGMSRGSGKRGVSFPLFDRRKRFGQPRRPAVMPRISFLDEVDPTRFAKPKPSDDDPVKAARLQARLLAIKNALDDLPRQARRLLRAQARRAMFREPGKVRPTSPMRPGWPPGRRKRHIHPVDKILEECHGLAWYLGTLPDTS